MNDSHGAETLLERTVPHWQVRERHTRDIAASPAAVFAAVAAVTVGEVRLLSPLMAVRALPMRLTRSDSVLVPEAPVVGELVRVGFVLLGERPDRELLIGEIGRPWWLSGALPLRTIDGADSFAAFAEPGFAKVAMNFLLTPDAGATQLSTETRVLTTSPSARRAFGRYWRVIGWDSGVIRRSWLAAIARHAEAAG